MSTNKEAAATFPAELKLIRAQCYPWFQTSTGGLIGCVP